jgi:hypothetical protein
MTITFDERLEMLQQASLAWRDLKRVVDRVNDEALERPNTIGTWRGRDVLAHIANWEEVGISMIAEMDAGQPEQWPDTRAIGLDAFNEQMLTPYRDLSLEEVKQYFEGTHYALMNLAETSQAIRPALLLDITRDHYAQHIDDLRKLAKPGKTDKKQ